MFHFFDYIYSYLTSGIYDFFTHAIAFFIEKFTIFYIQMKIDALTFAWNIGSQVLDDLNLSSKITSAWGSIPAQFVQPLAFFRIPEVVNNLLTGVATRFVLRFMPI